MAVMTTCMSCGNSWKPSEPSACRCRNAEGWGLLLLVAVLALSALTGCTDPDKNILGKPRYVAVYYRSCDDTPAEVASRRAFMLECVKANTIRGTQTFSPEDMVESCAEAASKSCPKRLLVGPVQSFVDSAAFVPCAPGLDPERLDICRKAGWEPPSPKK